MVVCCTATYTNAEVTMDKSNNSIRVLTNGSLFAEYRTASGGQPVIWPIIGPTGTQYTRSYPVGARLESERADHPHHQSLWFAHGDVNGHDFWHNTILESETEIRHSDFMEISSVGNLGTVISKNKWIAEGKHLLSDTRRIHFGVEADLRWIDITIKLTAVEEDVQFGDTKEGTFAVRVAGSMKVDSAGRGKILNSLGQRNENAWGTPAEWVDYCGPIAGETVGIAIMCHPESFRHPTRWHVRPYGLFAANPFGEADFLPAPKKQGTFVLKHGEMLCLRYRVLFHKGNTCEAGIEEQYKVFAADDIGSCSHPRNTKLLVEKAIERR